MLCRFSITGILLVLGLLMVDTTTGWGQIHQPIGGQLPPGPAVGVAAPFGGQPRHAYFGPGATPALPVAQAFGPPPAPGLVLPTNPPVPNEGGGTNDPPTVTAEPFAFPEQPTWYAPPLWWDWKTWDVSFEIGLNGTEGNSESVSFQTGGDLKRETDTGKLAIEAKYFRTQADGVESQNNGWFKSRYDWKFGKPPWTMYSKSELYYDEFKVFDLRLVLNGGLGYQWLKTDATSLGTRVGAGASREFGGVDDDWAPEANLGIDFEHQLTKVQKLTATVDYYPEFGDFSSYRVVADLGWQMVVDAEANLSLKLGILDQYDSTPNGARPNDVNYTMLLIWKK
ncbi:MAG TPA: DUF481 domain-containing protein [Planctomycetaceae bacterium]|nr:mucin-like protein [Blastopirellula sp.]HAY79707.1 DUF481 domain-containing protein [Planctomycetaceae bacterium]